MNSEEVAAENDFQFEELVRLIDLGSKLHKNPENMRIIEQTFNPVDFLPNLNSQNLSETSVSTTISKRSKLDLKNDHGKTDNNIKQTKCIKPMQPVVSKSVRKRMLHHDANDMLLDVPLTKKSSQSSNFKLEKSVSLVKKDAIKNHETINKDGNKIAPQNNDESFISSFTMLNELDIKNLKIFSPLKNQHDDISTNDHVKNIVVTEPINEAINYTENEVFKPAKYIINGAEVTNSVHIKHLNKNDAEEFPVTQTPIDPILTPNKLKECFSEVNSKNHSAVIIDDKHGEDMSEGVLSTNVQESSHVHENIESMGETDINSEQVNKTQECVKFPNISNSPNVNETEQIVCIVTSKYENETPMEQLVDQGCDEPSFQIEAQSSKSPIKQNNQTNQDTRKSGRSRKRKLLPAIKTRQTPMGLPKPERPAKKKFTIEEIYTNKNYSTPVPKSLETIFEFPKQTKSGTLQYTERKKKIRTMYFCTNPADRIPKKISKKGTKLKYRTRSNKTSCVESDQKLSIMLSTLEQRLKLNNLS